MSKAQKVLNNLSTNEQNGSKFYNKLLDKIENIIAGVDEKETIESMTDSEREVIATVYEKMKEYK